MKGKTIFLAAGVIAIVTVSLLFGMTGCAPQRNAEKEEHSAHEEHEHHEYDADAAHDQHDEGDHDEHQGDDHGEDIVSLTDEALELAGIEIDTVKLGRISRTLELPGEVGFNEDRVVHITPRFGGITTKVLKKLGQHVLKDEELAIIESNESMAPYTLRSPMTGWVIEKHISNGEFVSEETSIYVIADLSEVWVNLAVYPKDAQHIDRGQRVTLESIANDLHADGLISYIGQVYSKETRRLTARVGLPNPDGLWKPGMFVKGTIALESPAGKIVVAREAIQIVNQKPTVFIIKGKNEFEPVHVVTGESDERLIEIVSGNLQLGDQYAARGAFDIKAHLVTGSLDAHAGHGH
ncbi:efflux RND transporter periplasmic adaptor subunit [Candidatus Zixiibacteriota bacterium]